MRSVFGNSLQAAGRLGLVLAAALLSLSLLVHFSADLAWSYGHASALESAQGAGVAPDGESERASPADPDDGGGALLPQAWSVPAWSTLVAVVLVAPRGRAQPRHPLLHPPSLH